MGEYNEECLKTFLEKQEQLFDEPVTETPDAEIYSLDLRMALLI